MPSKIVVLSANLNNFDTPVDNAEQTVAHDFCLFTDENFPPRDKAMTSRMQARIPKCFGWQLCPDYDYYIWHDASVRLSQPDSIEWFLEHLEDADMAVLKHPDRDTIQQEADYLKKRLIIEKAEPKRNYVLKRYENEWIDEHLEEVDPTQPLYASTAFIYRNTPEVQEALKEWWYFISRYHIIDQLGFPEAIKDLEVNVIPDDYMECEYLEFVRT